jgi:hypothetical protein
MEPSTLTSGKMELCLQSTRFTCSLQWQTITWTAQGLLSFSLSLSLSFSLFLSFQLFAPVLSLSFFLSAFSPCIECNASRRHYLPTAACILKSCYFLSVLAVFVPRRREYHVAGALDRKNAIFETQRVVDRLTPVIKPPHAIN